MQSPNPSTQQNFIEGNFVCFKKSLTKRHLIVRSLGSAVAHSLLLSSGPMLASAEPVSAVTSYVIQAQDNFWINCI